MKTWPSVRSVGRVAAFGAWTGSVVLTHRALAAFRPTLDNPRAKRPFIHTWSRGVFPMLGLDLRVEGRAPLGGPYLVVANHRSPLDILVCVHLVGGVVLSHHGVESIPVIGAAARATDTIFVDRADQRSGARAIRTMRRRLQEGHNLIVFPEGTTFRGDEVRPFKRGAFTAAKGLPVEVLPIGVAYEPGCEFFEESFGTHMTRMFARRRTPIWATIGEPEPLPKTAADEESLRTRIQGLVDRAAAARDRR